MSDTNAVPGIYATRLIDTTAGWVPAVVNVNPTTGAAVPDITRGSGPIDANTQRVTLATDDPGVAALASIDAKTVPVLDSTGQPFNPDSCTHTYGYSAGLLVTDTATDGATSWVKTYTYTSGVLSAESKWVKQ